MRASERHASLPLGHGSQFRQDPELTEAIDQLYADEQLERVVDNSENLLPNRILELSEVRELVKNEISLNGDDLNLVLSEVQKQRFYFKSIIVDVQADQSVQEIQCRRKPLIKKIEGILDEVNKMAERGETPKLELRNQRLWSNCVYDFDRVTLKSFAEAKKTSICYSDSNDRTRFSTIVFVLTKVHELLTKRLTVTRRELFYQNVARFRKQSTLDTAVRDVCCLLESPPWHLGVVATAKGLVAGPLVMVARNGAVVDCMNSGGVLIPQDVSGIQSLRSTARYVLVVEKDAIFQKLLDEGALMRLGPVIIITGKGYPDVCTRQLVARLTRELRLPALALVDADPHGLEIYLTYKYGSLAQSHLSHDLSCGKLRLLGARHADAVTLAPAAARLPLTARDRRKIQSLMRRPYLDAPACAPLRAELRAMLASGVKAELEAVAPTASELCDAYIPAKLRQLRVKT
ncbi:hypothetical protein EVAR_13148_1 [Eumeta japonica]|uniref:DNA topoisomerase (ATP-hydrolyzing) n=1 Tax=Eumeta variegata TaxID=151549 RepID=A0A4C1UAN1_EUMVA|nr:hypothetical protein EVAR_13148_1 [Eumeta japonica]